MPVFEFVFKKFEWIDLCRNRWADQGSVPSANWGNDAQSGKKLALVHGQRTLLAVSYTFELQYFNLLLTDVASFLICFQKILNELFMCKFYKWWFKSYISVRFA